MTTVSNVSSDVMSAMNGGAGSSKGVAESEENKFMTLLVTQMKNQDPLNPLDNAQMTSQLAQLSTLSGIDKLTTASGTKEGQPRPYRFGYGVLDENLNGRRDDGEKKVYFEISDYTNALFFQNPR